VISTISANARGGARFTLRAATASAHQALEDDTGPISDLPAYGRYARGLLAFRAALEPALEAFALVHRTPWRPTASSDLLSADLLDLGILPIPRCSVSIGDEARALGAMYVLEGSGLGARVLIKQAQALGLGPDFGARHLWRQAAGQDAWRIFLAALERSPADMEEVAASAIATFELARDCMRRARHG
jgi:heme oxygenase